VTESDGAQKVRLLLFGGFRLQFGKGVDLPLSSRKGRALIAYLCHSPGMTASRDKLADILWGDNDTAHSRNSLRQTLGVLRKELPEPASGLLIAGRDAIALRTSLVECDTSTFLEGLGVQSAEQLESAAESYTGQFLDGFHSGSDVFEVWATMERERLAGVAITLFERLARMTAGERAIGHARRLLTIDPAREASYRLNIELLAVNGHRDLAIKTYDACLAILKEEYGVAPSEETARLIESILKQVNGKRDLSDSQVSIARAAHSSANEAVVEILPFVSLTGESSEEFVSRGLVQDITSALSNQRLVVRSFVSPRAGANGEASSFTESPANRYFLSGGVQTVFNRIRVNIQLVDSKSGHTVWAERFDGAAEDLLEFQDRVAQSVAIAIRIELQLTSWKVRDKSPPGGPEVRKLVNQSLTKYYEFTQESLRESLELAEQALQIEPNNARAVRTTSVALSMGMAFGSFPISAENLARAVECGEAAVRTVPNDEIARTYYAFALLCAGRNEEAVSELQHAIEINPDYPNARGDLAEHYALMGRTEDALRQANEATRLNSWDPVEFWRHHYIALAKFAAGDDEGALDAARRVVKLKPGFVRGALYWAAAAAATGNLQEASRAIHHCLSYMPDLRVSNVSPGFVPRYVRDDQHGRFLQMLKRAGMKA
jgi:DNA-binding SARP family transcriptional activator